MDTTLPIGPAPLSYYRHSGRFALSTVIFALTSGAIAAFILGAIYGFVMLYIPLAEISFVLTAGFGFAVGYATLWALRWGRVRNTPVAVGVSLIVALVALYTSWALWLYAVLQRDGYDVPLTEVMAQPQAMWELILIINEAGAWTLGGTTFNGLALWAVWGAEALFILGVGVYVPMKGIGGIPFCEACDRWCNASEGIISAGMGDGEQIKRRIEAGEIDYLESLGLADMDAPHRYRIDLHSCTECNTMHTVTVNRIDVGADRKGNRSEKVRPLVYRLIVSPEDAQRVREIQARFNAARDQASTEPAPDAVPQGDAPSV